MEKKVLENFRVLKRVQKKLFDFVIMLSTKPEFLRKSIFSGNVIPKQNQIEKALIFLTDEIKCSLVITIIGSAALEAAFYEKPSMVFTDINYAILPSVMKIDSIDMLADSINKSLQTKVLPEDLERYISLVEKNSFIADIFALRTNQHNHFHYGGHLIDVEISAEKMEEFLEQNKETLDILAEKNLERMKFLKINKSS